MLVQNSNTYKVPVGKRFVKLYFVSVEGALKIF
jgi:hypothetical protein